MMKQLTVTTIVVVLVCVASQVCRADNVALGKLTSAEGQYGGYGPARAVDGDTATEWFSASSSGGMHWLKVDLDGVYNVTSIVADASNVAVARLNGSTLTVYEKSDGTGDTIYSNTITVSVAQPIQTFNIPGGITAASIKISGIGDGQYMAITELFAYGTPVTNVALSKTATADSSYPGLTPDKAVDSDVATRWHSDDGAAMNWWKVELEGLYDIDMVEVRATDTVAERTDGAKLMLHLSSDVLVYSNVVDVADDNTSPFDTRQLTHNFIMPEDIAACSVKLSKADRLNLAEVRVYGTPRVNLALNKTAVSDSNYNASIYPGMAVDGDMDTRWLSGLNGLHWLRVDLGEKYDIELIQIRMVVGSGSRVNGSILKLYSSSDASGSHVYSNTVSGVSNEDPVCTFVLPSDVTARSVKLSGYGDGGYLDCGEMRVYGRTHVPNGTVIIVN